MVACEVDALGKAYVMSTTEGVQGDASFVQVMRGAIYRQEHLWCSVAGATYGVGIPRHLLRKTCVPVSSKGTSAFC